MSSTPPPPPPPKPKPESGPADDVEIEMVDVAGEQLAILSWPIKRSLISALSPIEEGILRGIATGKSNAEIAKERGTSPRTVANQVATLLKKFGVASRYELVVAMSSKRELPPQ